MKTIYKYPLNLNCTFITGKIEKFLDVQIQNDVPVVWALINEELEEKEFGIYLYGTGWSLIEVEPIENYIGTIQDGDYVWHCFWEECGSIGMRRCRYSEFEKGFGILMGQTKSN